MNNSFENVKIEAQKLTLDDRFDELDKRFDELGELIEKAHKEELEYLKLKAENRKRRAEQGLLW
jgi:hypothetical protein